MSCFPADKAAVQSAEGEAARLYEQHCPLCGGLNQCAVAAQTEPSACWCFQMDARLSECLRQRADASDDYLRQTSCICPGCASAVMSAQARMP